MAAASFEGPVTSGAVMPIVRVAILADSRLTEMALPAELPLREILPAVKRLAAPTAANGDAGDTLDTLAASYLSLAPIGGAPFSLDASLDTVGVVDGDLLALQPVPAGPAAPGIVEDIADAAMIFSTSRLRPWGTAHIQRGALAAAIVAAFLATGLGVTYRVATGALSGLVAVSVIARAHRDGRPADHGPFGARRNGSVDRGLGTHRRGLGVGGARQIRAGATDAGRGRRHRVVADRPDGSRPGA